MIEITFPSELSEQLAWLVALCALVIGLVVLVMPGRAGAFLGLAALPGNNNGLSELRGALGGVWAGLGISCLLLAQPLTYFALGMALMFAVIGRIVSFFADRTLNAHCIALTLIEAAGAWFVLKFAGSALMLF